MTQIMEMDSNLTSYSRSNLKKYNLPTLKSFWYTFGDIDHGKKMIKQLVFKAKLAL